MLRVYAGDYVELGLRLEAAIQVLERANDITQSPWGRPLTSDETDNLLSILNDVWMECGKLNLNVSGEIIQDSLTNPPSTARELDILIGAIRAELRFRVFLFVPPHLAQYHDLTTPDDVASAFPSVESEFRSSGNCIAVGEFTASVFHAMRAAEIGVRCLA
jgi:hypothetical protein